MTGLLQITDIKMILNNHVIVRRHLVIVCARLLSMNTVIGLPKGVPILPMWGTPRNGPTGQQRSFVGFGFCLTSDLEMDNEIRVLNSVHRKSTRRRLVRIDHNIVHMTKSLSQEQP